MKILISGASGFIGKHLCNELIRQNHTLTVISRDTQKIKRIFGTQVSCLTRDEVDQKSLGGIECVIHLAGSSLSDIPWTSGRKKRMRESRINTTKLLVQALPDTCHSFFCGSAIGYYPSDTTTLYETSFVNTKPSSFMERLCVDREKEASAAKSQTRRVVHLRTGLVLGPEKLEKILRRSTKRFGGIILGSGTQRMPTIQLDERVNNCISVINDPSIAGPVNMVSENITHREYIENLAKELNRPVWLRVPSIFLSVLLGEASTLMLGSRHITPFKSQ